MHVLHSTLPFEPHLLHTLCMFLLFSTTTDFIIYWKKAILIRSTYTGILRHHIASIELAHCRSIYGKAFLDFSNDKKKLKSIFLFKILLECFWMRNFHSNDTWCRRSDIWRFFVQIRVSSHFPNSWLRPVMSTIYCSALEGLVLLLCLTCFEPCSKAVLRVKDNKYKEKKQSLTRYARDGLTSYTFIFLRGPFPQQQLLPMNSTRASIAHSAFLSTSSWSCTPEILYTFGMLSNLDVQKDTQSGVA